MREITDFIYNHAENDEPVTLFKFKTDAKIRPPDFRRSSLGSMIKMNKKLLVNSH
jgi:hypothetical protein